MLFRSTTHYMEEVEQICTKIAIMDRGKKIAEGSSDELKKLIKNTETVSIEMEEPGEALLKAINNTENVYEVTYGEGKLKIALAGGKHNLLNILDVLKSRGTVFGQVYSERPTLNDVFLTITGKELRDKE